MHSAALFWPVPHMSNAAPQLEYAPAQPNRARRRRIILYVLLGFLCVALLALWVWWKPIREQVVLRYWQHRCMKFSEPPDRVVWEEDPDELRRLKAMPSAYRMYLFTRSRSTFAFRVPPPEYAHTQFGRWGPGPVFMHGRRGPDGVERLVVVGLDSAFNVGVVPCAIPPSGRSPWNAGGIGLVREPSDVFRVFAGQCDPK